MYISQNLSAPNGRGTHAPQPHRILVVDDEPDLEILITQRFRKRIRTDELAFIFAANGEEALSKLQSERDPADVVLTDINMPVMDGLTLLSKLRDGHPLLRSVIVSAYGDMPNIRTALNRGAFDFVTKPIDFTDLEITLDRAIEESVMRRQAAHDRDRLVGMHYELELARTIQESLVPCEFPTERRFEIYGSMIPAHQVGGDLFDFFELDSRHLAFTVGDVSGKGISAALMMAVTRTVLRMAAGEGLSPSACLKEVNRFLCRDRVAGKFVTCCYGIFELDTGRLEYCLAGHNPPYVHRASGGAVETLNESSGLPLGLFTTATFDTGTVQLERGDTLVAFTDGITEATDSDHSIYGEERLEKLLAELAQPVPAELARPIPIAELVRLIIGEATAFVNGAPPSDDMTVLAIRYFGPS